MVKINKDACIGCGSCTMLASDVFDLNDDGLAYVKDGYDASANKDEIDDAIESCPTSAIYDDNEITTND